MTQQNDKIITMLFFTFIASLCSAELVQRFTLQNGSTPYLDQQPMSISLDGKVEQDRVDELVIYEVRKDARIPLQTQVCESDPMQVWFVPSQSIGADESLTLEVHTEKVTYRNPVQVQKDEQSYTLAWDGHTILSYHHALHPVPEGVDPVFRRSGFIHPLYSPAGHVFTQIQPPDHYHHYGIWNPWTRTNIEGQQVDFWNLGEKQGTVRFAKLLSTVSGPVFGSLQVQQEHVQFLPDGGERVAINEIWDLRASPFSIASGAWIVDLTCTLSNVLSVPIELEQYRYGGGLGFRATEQWNKDNCKVLTSEGKTRNEADGTRARWCDVRGAFDGSEDTSGILFLSHTANREHPEPMRVWPENIVENGGMFFEFCPIRLNGWTLQPDQDYILRYRMIVYDGTLEPETMERLWKNYTQPPVITSGD